MRPTAFSALALSTAVLVLAAVSPAAAKIECRDNFQVTKYGLISTPYCEERQIARVARSYGFNVSDAEIRNNPNAKVYYCQIIGNDNRLKGSCGAYAEPRGFPW
ncbi:MAG TPA: hypothetical protein VJT12_06075 [Methyloceanibacter sp.]|nr:hypothetical protein [Methyloceanibacter sp.]